MSLQVANAGLPVAIEQEAVAVFSALAVVDASRKATSRDPVSGDFRTCVTPVAHNEVVGITYAEGMSGSIHFVVCHAALGVLSFRLRRIDLGGRGAFQESQKAQNANT